MMGYGLFLLVVLVIFTWLVVRSVRAGHGKLLAAIVLLPAGVMLAVMVLPGGGERDPVLANGFLLLVLAVPVWLLVSWIRSAPRRGK